MVDNGRHSALGLVVLPNCPVLHVESACPSCPMYAPCTAVRHADQVDIGPANTFAGL